MNERTSRPGGAADDPADPRLAALYREAAQEGPPAHLDAAIFAAARREVGAGPRPAGMPFLRTWRLPMAVAAAVVLSASVVTLMWEEGGGRLLHEPAPRAVESTQAPPAAPSSAEQLADARSEAMRDQSQPGAAVPAPTQAMPQRAESPQTRPAAPAPEPGLARRGQDSVAERRRSEAPATAMTAPLAKHAETAATAEQAARTPLAALPAAKPAPRQFSLAQQYEHEPPQKWLEKIVELRRSGRQAEADELLEAFRKRFPDHPLPEALR